MSLRLLRASTSNVVRRFNRPFSVSASCRLEVDVPPPTLSSINDGPPTAPTHSHPRGAPPRSARKDDIGLNPLTGVLKGLQYHVHVVCTSNNTHITLTDEIGRPIPEGTWSGGLVGFKGVNRSGYEAAYQCAIRAFARMTEVTLDKPGARFELLFKGFGQGRDAVYKALMTSEGELIRQFVNRVTDKTPIKIGGTRARKVRRL
ncbi:translational machinery component [Auriscalpium vulgare]|uniref:Translational machinery component n=1 Tax=Auriscalpium vulgare TaxID=40419 RepID=A0ACB8RU70_9AGAM|nr:translational machinery component [Auriscalpium vulgare]